MNKAMIVTSALPYGNGHIHLGHMVEHIQTDIWVRTQRMLGRECYSICGDDAHGTPIMLKAQEMGITPEALTDAMRESHLADFKAFAIDYDCYHTTHSPENEALAREIFLKLQAAGSIATRRISQLFDPEKNMFLPDRFIRGTCPKCKAADQYGDSCEVCGATYSPTELIEPRSALSGAIPIEKESEHYFFDLPKYETLLREWMQAGHLQPEVAKKLEEWFEQGLKQWDISRDAPYFGFLIPETTDKYFYVWLDAPIGYMASFKKLAAERNLDFDAFWQANSQTELYHFVGKDIVYFHALFWPALLAGSGHRKPTAVFTHGFLTVNGQKMSKSRGTFIEAKRYLEHLNPEYLRYYFAAKMNGRVEDLDLSFDDFTARVNADLVGKIVNIASRAAGFVQKHFDGKLSASKPDIDLMAALLAERAAILDNYLARDYAQAMRRIMALADKVNQYIDNHKPWALARDASQLPAVHEIISTALNAFRILMTYLKPVLPVMAAHVESFLQVALTLDNLDVPLCDHPIAPFTPLIERVDSKSIEALMSKQTMTTAESLKAPAKKDDISYIGIDDFSKVDLRVAQILQAEPIEGADKLLRLQLDIGQEQPIQVFAGIKKAYKPEDLQGRLTVVVANLAPRTMRFGVSQGMVLCAGDGEGLYLLNPDQGAKPGMKIA